MRKLLFIGIAVAALSGIGLATGWLKIYKTDHGCSCSSRSPHAIDPDKLHDFVVRFAAKFGASPGVGCDPIGDTKGATTTCTATYADGTTRRFTVTNDGDGQVSVVAAP